MIFVRPRSRAAAASGAAAPAAVGASAALRCAAATFLGLALLAAARAQAPSAPPSSSETAALSDRQAALFAANCAQCHAQPRTGAPQAGDAAAWRERRAQGEERLLAHVVLGMGGMPPLGYCSACTEDDLRAMIRLLVRAP